MSASKVVTVAATVSSQVTPANDADLATLSFQPGAMVELLGSNVLLDELARAAGTIGYELLTRLGPRWQRRYEP